MCVEELRERLLRDLSLINMPVDEVDFYFRPYSKTYYGRYFPVRDFRDRPRVFIYPYASKCGELMSYSKVFSICVHEMCHHIQYMDSSFVRNKGVMHNTTFWKLYNHYMERAERFELIESEDENVLLAQ